MSQLYLAPTLAAWESQQASSAFMDASENVVLAGQATSNGTTSAVAALYHAKFIWANTYAGGYATMFEGITQLTDGSYMAAGSYFNSSSSSDSNIWLVNIDASGNKTWDKQFGSSGVQSNGIAVVPTPSGGCIVIGSIIASDIAGTRVICLDASKNAAWDITIPSFIGFSITAGASNTFLISGRVPASGLNSHPAAVIINSSGSILSNFTFSQFSLYVLQDADLIQTSDGNYFMAAQSVNFKFNSSGQVLWSNKTNNGVFNSVAELSNGNLAISGAIIVSNTDYPYTVVTDSSGNTIIWDNTGFNPGNFNAVFIDTAYQVVWSCGSDLIGNTNSEILLAAFNPATTLAPSGSGATLSAMYKTA